MPMNMMQGGGNGQQPQVMYSQQHMQMSELCIVQYVHNIYIIDTMLSNNQQMGSAMDAHNLIMMEQQQQQQTVQFVQVHLPLLRMRRNVIAFSK
jgi:hypothetical protein